MERAIVAVIVVEDLTEGPYTADSFLEARGGVVMFCGGGFSVGIMEDMARN